jgi:hypothetical protein
MKKLLGMLILLNVVSPAFAWKHWVYNYTGEKIAVTPYGVANPYNAPVNIEPTASKVEIDMGGYLTNGFTVAGIDTKPDADLKGVEVYFDHPFRPDIGPGVTLYVYEEDVGTPIVLESNPNYVTQKKKTRMKVVAEHYSGRKETIYSPEKEVIKTIVGRTTEGPRPTVYVQ